MQFQERNRAPEINYEPSFIMSRVYRCKRFAPCKRFDTIKLWMRQKYLSIQKYFFTNISPKDDYDEWKVGAQKVVAYGS